MLEKNGLRYCDRCGCLLTKRNNNKCGYEICDSCNEILEKEVKELKENRCECN